MRAIPFVGKVGQRAVDEVEVERGKPGGGGVVAEDMKLVGVGVETFREEPFGFLAELDESGEVL